MSTPENALTVRDVARINRALARPDPPLFGVRFWLFFGADVVLAVSAVSIWCFGWYRLGIDATRAGLTRSQVATLSGVHGRPLTAVEADLVQLQWVLGFTSVVVGLIALAPFALLLARKAALFERRLYRRLQQLGGP